MPTTIQLTEDTKRRLEDAQLDSESFNDTVRRLLGESRGDVWTEEEIRQIASEVVESYTHR